MSEHTKEPWAIDPDDRLGMEWNNHIVSVANPDRTICFMSHDGTAENIEFQANARRIVYCVNACAGIPTGMLEAAGQSAVIALRPVDELVAERNALLAALKVIAWNADMYLPATIRQVATEAIAQVKL